ncbi:hypothetical protein AB1Y20_001969 [Prymnesium parvum]|uniref:Uncharacterized protein n=1 Tax=Prymnesium parvum TaxID=97485 RepID=A0AB34J7J0_PRYPA
MRATTTERRARRCWCEGDVSTVVAGHVGEVLLHLPLPARGESPLSRARLRVDHDDPRARAPEPALELRADVAVAAGRARLRYGPVHAAGRYFLSVSLDGAAVSGSPFRLHCVAAAADGGRSEFRVAAAPILAGERASVRVLSRDKWGNACGGGGACVEVRLLREEEEAAEARPLREEAEECVVTDLGDGTYEASVRLCVAGRYKLQGEIYHEGGERQPIGLRAATPPHCTELRVLPGAPFAPRCEARGAPLARLVVAEEGYLSIVCKDRLGNRCEPRPELRWEARLDRLVPRLTPAAAPLVGAGWHGCAPPRFVPPAEADLCLCVRVEAAGCHQLTLRPCGAADVLAVRLHACPGAADPAGFLACGKRRVTAGEPSRLRLLPRSFASAEDVAAASFGGLRAWLAFGEEAGGGPLVPLRAHRIQLAARGEARGEGEGEEGGEGEGEEGGEGEGEEGGEGEGEEGGEVEGEEGGEGEGEEGGVLSVWPTSRCVPPLSWRVVGWEGAGWEERERWELSFTSSRAGRAVALHIELFGQPICGAPFLVEIEPAPTDSRRSEVSGFVSRVVAGQRNCGVARMKDRLGNWRRRGGDAVWLLVQRGRHAKRVEPAAAAEEEEARLAPLASRAICGEGGGAAAAAADDGRAGRTHAWEDAADGRGEDGEAEEQSAAWSGGDSEVDEARTARSGEEGGEECRRRSKYRARRAAAWDAAPLVSHIPPRCLAKALTSPTLPPGSLAGGSPKAVGLAPREDRSDDGREVKDLGDGTYHLAVAVERAGLCSVQVYLGAQPVGAPWPFVVVAAQMSASRSQLVVIKKRRLVGKAIAIALQARDEFGNPARHEPGAVDVCVLRGEGGVEPLEHISKGRYEALAWPSGAGLFQVGVYVRGEHVQGSPYSTTICSGQTVPHLCFAVGDGWRRRVPVQQTLTFDVHALDEARNPQHPTTFLVTLAPRAPSSKVSRLFALRHNGRGVATYGYRVHKEGLYTLSVTLEGVPIKDSPLEFEAYSEQKEQLERQAGRPKTARRALAESGGRYRTNTPRAALTATRRQMST